MATEGAFAAQTEDQAARRRALATDASFLVRAPAGSGKTELLIQRTLALLAEVDQPEAVVALTFTRKAAGEMRARLLAALAAAAGPAPAESHARQTWELAQRVRARDQELAWGLAAAPARLRVMTLDALALALVRRMPWRARQGGAPQPEERPERLYREAAQAVLEELEQAGEAGEAARQLLRQVEADLEKAVELVAALLPQRDQWLPLVAGGEGAALCAAVEAELRARVEAELAAIRAALGAGLAPALPPGAAGCLPQWRSLADAALTKAGTLRKQPPSPLELDERGCKTLHRVRDLPPLDLEAPQRAMIAALALVLPRAAAALNQIFLERGRCDFVAVALAAARGLGDADAPTALAYALDGQLRHLLVDEFQDTSQAQYELLAKLVADWQPCDGRTLFLVGDPMQSIFRFRNARLELSLRAAAEGHLGPVPLETLQLRHNYRSQPEVVAWHNRIFATLFPDADDLLAGTAGFTPAVASSAGEGAVRLHSPADAAAEAVAVAALAEQELTAGAAEVAILVFARTHLRAILPELRRRGIAFTGVKLQTLGQSQTVADLVALARAIHDPADRVAWLALLRGPWCGLPLADLHALCEGDAAGATVVALWRERRGALSPEGQARAARTLAVLEAAMAQARRQPPRGLVEWCWQALGGAACAGAAGAPAAAAFFEALEAHAQPGGGVDFDALAGTLATLVAPPAADAGARVTIMTAHTAKGLEFDAVIVPGLERALKADPPRLLRWLERAVPEGTGWLMAGKPRRGNDDALFAYVGRVEQQQHEQEQLRLLYVLATRARRRLHLLAARPRHPNPDARAPLKRLWPALGGAFAWPALPPGTPQVREAPPLRRVPAGWSPPPPDEVAWQPPRFAPPPSERPLLRSPAGAEVRALGTALHAALRRMAEGGERGWDPAQLQRWLRQGGLGGAGLERAAARAEAALGRMVADERGRWILAGHAEARCEWAVSGLVEGAVQHAVMDRSFVDESGSRWVIDYKTGGHEGAGTEAFLEEQVETYRPQIADYVRLVAALEPGRRVRAGLYFTALTAWREIDVETGRGRKSGDDGTP